MYCIRVTAPNALYLGELKRFGPATVFKHPESDQIRQYISGFSTEESAKVFLRLIASNYNDQEHNGSLGKLVNLYWDIRNGTLSIGRTTATIHEETSIQHV